MSANSQRVTIIDPSYPSGSVKCTSQEYLQAIAEGDIPGHSIFEKIGYSPASTAAETTLWTAGSAYVFPAGAISVEAVSASASDTSAGTGARTVQVIYLDINYVQKEFVFTMNGATPVAGPTDFFRVNTFHIETAGSGGKAAGLISLRLVGGGATVYSQMPAGATRSRNSSYTVPAGQTVYIQSILLSAAYSTAGKAVRMILHASKTPDGNISTAGTIFWPQMEAMLVDNALTFDRRSPIIFPSKTDIKVSVIGETNAICTSAISGWIE